MNYRITMLICAWATCAFCQPGNLVATDGITHAIHRNNVGRIVFLGRNVPIDSLSENDFLKEYRLNRRSNLNIRVFLDNSIINYQHPLAPSLSAEQLRVSGNYQFSFYVDEKLIYQENIHYGCGLRKNTTTTFRVPFTDTHGGDWWSIYLFDRFMEHGGSAALTDGRHLFRVEMRPYLTLEQETRVGALMASGQLELIIETPGITEQEIAVQPVPPHPDFERSKAAFDVEKIEALNEQIARAHFKQITSIVVLKQGDLLLEEYFNDADRNTLHDTRSVGKSFTSTLLGIAIADGYINRETRTLGTFYDLHRYAAYSEKKAGIRLKDLLTMSAALDGSDQNGDSPGNEENMYPTNDWVRFALDLPVDNKKENGKQWDYFTAGVVLLGDILDKSVPRGLEKYADEKLFKPLHISRYQWEYTPQKVVNTAGGLKMSSLDLAKVGQLYKNGGVWNGQRILPRSWVRKSHSRHLAVPERHQEFYGYLFWNKTYRVGNRDYEVYYCAGNGGSKVFIFKDQPLVVVVTATAYNRPYGHSQVDKMMTDYIIPAIAGR